MDRFNQTHMDHIKEIFEEKTGAALVRRRPRRVGKALLLAAVLVLCLGVTAFAGKLFSGLDEDQLSLSAVYLGDGLVAVQVENGSDVPLRFQPALRLVRWRTGEEVAPLGQPAFSGTDFQPHSAGTMTIDLSAAYDLALLEEPLEAGDWYYLVLTNHHFAFGQDWQCGVDFAPARETPVTAEPLPPARADQGTLARIEESLRPYFEDITFDSDQRAELNWDYMERVRALLADFDGTVVPSVAPFLLVDGPAPGTVLDETYPLDRQHELTGENHHYTDWDFKLLATDEEEALVLSVNLPLEGYQDTFRGLPVFYLYTFQREAVSEDAYAFIYGQVVPFTELEAHKVYEDGDYVCYDASDWIYSDLEDHVQRFLEQNPDVRFDGRAQALLENYYDYYKAHMGELFYYK